MVGLFSFFDLACENGSGGSSLGLTDLDPLVVRTIENQVWNAFDWCLWPCDGVADRIEFQEVPCGDGRREEEELKVDE